MDRHGAVGRAAWAVAFGLVAAGAAIGAYPPQTGDAGQPPPIPGQPVTGQPPPVVGQPVQSVTTTPPAVASSIPETYVYVVRGVDPMGWSGVSGLANQIRAGGYPNTRYGFWYQMPQFEREIRQLYRQNPGIQVVLIGHSAGVYQVRAAANRLTRDGVPVSMVGYVGGDYLRDSSYTRVNGATQVVNVTGDGYLLTGRNLFFNGTNVTGADNVRMPGVRHFALPKRSETSGALLGGMSRATRSW